MAYGCPLQLGSANGFIANGDVTKVPIPKTKEKNTFWWASDSKIFRLKPRLNNKKKKKGFYNESY